jgi:hypothetical protein
MTDDKIAEIVRGMIDHESEQIHRRLSWLGTFQGFLFAALGLACTRSKSLLCVIGVLGAVTASLVYVGLWRATSANVKLFNYWTEKRRDYEGPPVESDFPKERQWMAYLSAENLIPLAFVCAWLVVLTKI